MEVCNCYSVSIHTSYPSDESPLVDYTNFDESVMFALLAACNIIFSLAVMAGAFENGSYRRNRSTRQCVLDTILAIPKAIVAIFYCLALIPPCLFRRLPTYIKSRARFGARYLAKTGRRVPSAREVKLRHMRPKNSKSRYEGGYEGKGTAFTDFLCYDVLVLIARDLHYVDLVNLSLASKSVRDVVFPHLDFAIRSEHFKIYSCDELTKTQCWVCMIQICNVSPTPRSSRPPTN